MKRSVAALSILGVFLAGVLVGALALHLTYMHRLHEPGGMVGWGARLLARELKSDLDLTPEQARKVDAILADTRQEAMAVRRKSAPEMMAVLHRSRQRIEEILTPEQRKEFARLREKRLNRFRHWMGGR